MFEYEGKKGKKTDDSHGSVYEMAAGITYG